MSANVAFEILYREYYVRVYGLCRRLLASDSLAEDATQEAFMRAYRSFDKYDSQQPFWQWIAAIASNHCVDVLRKRNKTSALFAASDEDDLEQLGEDSSKQDLIGEIDDAKLVADCLSELPDKYRVPLVLAYFRELSYDEIAGELSISRSHVGVLLLRAKTRLRRALEKAGITEFRP